MSFLRALINWWNAESVTPKLPATMNNAAPRDHFAKVSDHFDKDGNYIFKSPSIEKMAKLAKSFASPSMPRGATMSITEVGTPATTQASTTLGVSPTAVGNCLVLCITSQANAATSAVAGGGVTTWTRAAIEGSLVDIISEIWYGTITSAGASTITITNSGSAQTALYCQEFHDSLGTNWAVDVTGAQNAGSSGSSGVYPSCTPNYSNELYVGVGIFYAGSPGGSSAGFTYVNPFGATGYEATSAAVFYVNVAAGTAYSPNWTQGASNSWGVISAVLRGHAFSAPSAPTLQSPANASTNDVSSGLAFTALYNSTDGQTQNAYAMRIKVSGGSYNYYNASTNALQSTIVWNTLASPTAPGGTWSVTLGSTLISDGNVYNWSMASQESGANLQGSFATDFTFTASAPPSVNVTAPTGTITGTDQPVVEWTDTLGGGTQADYQVWVESGAYGTSPGSGTSVWSSGVVASSATSVQVGVALTSGVTYRAFVQITNGAGQTSTLGGSSTYVTFTVQADVPAQPTLTAVAGNDSTTGAPMVTLTVQGNDNQLTVNQASAEGGNTTGWAAGTNTAIRASNHWFEDGSYSLELCAEAAGNVTANTPIGTSAFPVTPGETIRIMASFHSSATARVCSVSATFYDATGTALSSVTSPTVNSTTTGNGAQAFLTTTVPANAATADLNLTADSLNAPNATLATALTSGTAYTSLATTALTTAINSGDNVYVVSGTNSQVFVASTAAAIGATSISVNSATANFSYPVGSLIDPDAVYADEMLLAPGTSTTWTAGGFVGTSTASLTFSDDNVNWFAVRNGTALAIPAATQTVTVLDYEGPLGFTRHYQAQVSA